MKIYASKIFQIGVVHINDILQQMTDGLKEMNKPTFVLKLNGLKCPMYIYFFISYYKYLID